jgi:hypothetical protein
MRYRVRKVQSEVDDVLTIKSMLCQCKGGRRMHMFVCYVSTQEEETHRSVDRIIKVI